MMTNKEIYAIIDQNNKNEDIRWKVTKNNGSKIIIVNDYCDGCRFTIEVKDNGETLVLTDEGRDARTLWLIGNESWDDCESIAEAMPRAVRAAVNDFYYYY